MSKTSLLPDDEAAIQLMKLAAGELSQDEENSLLLDCEADPRRWRDVALALIEERRLAAALMPRTAVAPAPAKRGRRGAGWLAVAACLGMLIGGGLARLSAPPATIVRPEMPPSNNDRQEQLVSTSPTPLDLTPVSAAVRPWFSPEDYEAIERHGYRLTEEPVLYVVRDAEGRQTMIPSKNITLTQLTQSSL